MSSVDSVVASPLEERAGEEHPRVFSISGTTEKELAVGEVLEPVAGVPLCPSCRDSAVPMHTTMRTTMHTT
jgi:hypothetical protein